LNVTNNSPFALGLFFIGSKISRTGENVLYKERIAQIERAYYDAHPSTEGKVQSISLAIVINPNASITYEDHVLFRCGDLAGSSDLSMEAANQRVHNSQAWVNVSKKDLRDSVVNDNVGEEETDESRKMTYLMRDSKLWHFIKSNYKAILMSLGEPSNQAFPFEDWEMPLSQAVPSTTSQYLAPEKASEKVRVHPIPWRVTHKALELAEKMIDRLPFENLEEHRFYVARLDGTSWDDFEGGVDRKTMQEIAGQRFRVQGQVQSWFSIVTEAKHSQPSQYQQQQQ